MLVNTRSRSFVAILIALTMTSPVALTIYVPVMPSIAESFGTDFSTIQWSLTVYLIAVALGQLAYGPLSDVFGRLAVLKVGLLLFFLSSLVLALFPTISVLIAGRALQAIGACSGMVLARAMIRDTYGEHETAVMFAYVAMGFAVGPAIAPLIGGFLGARFGWQSIFIVLTIYAAILVLVSFTVIPETLKVRSNSWKYKQIFHSYGKLIRDGRFQSLILASACLSAVFFGFIGGAAFLFVDELNLGPEIFGLSMLALVSCFMAGSFLATRFARRLARETIIRIGFVFLIISSGLWVFFYLDGTTTVSRVIVPILIFSLGRGISEPFILSSSLNLHPEITGTAAGFLGFMQLTISGFFTILVPLVMGIETRGFFLLIGLAAIAAVCFYGLSRFLESSQPPT
jgi:DHA1 family bicyclomycin/chloramphenicol resistance-like MFS transporter